MNLKKIVSIIYYKGISYILHLMIFSKIYKSPPAVIKIELKKKIRRIDVNQILKITSEN